MKEKIDNSYEVFVDNKYMRRYFRIIHRSLSEDRVKNAGTYYESHHIYPLTLFEPNQDTVLLTAREHFVCHWLLIKFTSRKHREKMLYALNNMATTSNGRELWTALEYEVARKALSEAIRSDLTRGQKISASKKGKTFSPEHREALRQSQLGKKQSPEQIAKKSEALKRAHAEGRHSGMRGKTHAEVMSEETRLERARKISSALTGKPLSEEHRAKIKTSGFGQRNKGKTLPPEQKAKMAEARRLWWAKRKSIDA